MTSSKQNSLDPSARTALDLVVEANRAAGAPTGLPEAELIASLKARDLPGATIVAGARAAGLLALGPGGHIVLTERGTQALVPIVPFTR